MLTCTGSLYIPSLLSNAVYGNAQSNYSGFPGTITIGVQSYSFRDRSLDEAIAAMKIIGIKNCELWHGHTEPRDLLSNGPALKIWRDHTPVQHFEAIRKKFEAAGIVIQAYCCNMKNAITDSELNYIFQATKLLGTDTLTTSATVSLMKRIDGFAQKYNISVGMHNHSNLENPNEFSSPESLLRGMEGNSNLIGINLDIGHFVAANFDPVDFIKKYHDHIFCLHLKDRKKDQGKNVPYGEGDTPLREVLQLLKNNQWNIPCNLEYEYNGANTVLEVKNCFDYCKKALE